MARWWHGDEDDVRGAWQRRHQLDCWVRPDAGNACLVGKGRRPAAAVRGALAAIALHWTPGSLVRRGMPRTARRPEPSGGDYQLRGEGKALQGALLLSWQVRPSKWLNTHRAIAWATVRRP